MIDAALRTIVMRVIDAVAAKRFIMFWSAIRAARGRVAIKMKDKGISETQLNEREMHKERMNQKISNRENL